MKWNILENTLEHESIDSLSKLLQVDDRIATLLSIRGITTFEAAKAFFRPELGATHDPFLMQGMDVAVHRLDQAIKKQEKVLVFGDYDVDGTTSVSLVYRVLSTYLSSLETYIPDRYAEGYGLSYQAIDYAKEQGITLMLVLDCGTKDVEKIKYAQELGIDVIVCDHHTPGDVLPPAYALLNPKRKDCAYPFKELSACGVSYKFMQAFLTFSKKDHKALEQSLDLLAISIACDIVPLVGENRIFAYYGLEKLNQGANQGVQALFARAGAKNIASKKITDLVFILGPRINAAGRVDHGKKIVRLLTSTNDAEVNALADEVSKNNEDRKVLDKNITQEALDMIEQDVLSSQSVSTVLYKETWHKGVVGIVASRMIEKHYKPTIVLTHSNGKATGSARSVKGYNVYEAISACSDLLEQFGGHMYAAGLTLKPENVPLFKDRFEQEVQKSIRPELLIPSIDIDLEIDFEDITPKFIRILNQLEPFGPENMKPVFLTRNVQDFGGTALVGVDKKHLKLQVFQEKNPQAIFKGILFNKPEFFEEIHGQKPFDLVYTIEENHWQGNISYEINVKDLRFVD